MTRRLLLFVALSFAAGCGGAGDKPKPRAALARDDIQSCYAAVKLDVDAPAPSRTLFVLVDQTTGLDDRLRRTVTDNAERLLEPGTRFSIATFSANTGTDFATVLAEGNIETPLPEAQEADLPAKKVTALHQCLAMQRAYAVQFAGARLKDAMGASASSFSHSEILSSLTQLSHAVEAAPGSEKLVILVSDLIEHSGDTSFYANQRLRTIDPATELAQADVNHHVGRFAGAQVAVIGAGLISPAPGSPPLPRDPKALAALRSFWEEWFHRSGGRIVEYGEPDLVTTLSWSPPPASPAAS